MEEHAHEYVQMGQLKSSPYMWFAFQCTDKQRGNPARFIWMEHIGYKQSMKIKTRITTILSKQCIKRMVYLFFLILTTR